MRRFEMGKVVEKLNDILGGRFGVGVQYISINDSAKNHSVILETAKRNASAPLIVGNNQLIIPVRIEGSFVGATWVGDINTLSGRELSEVKATVDLFIAEEIRTCAEVSRQSGFNILPFERRAHA